MNKLKPSIIKFSCFFSLIKMYFVQSFCSLSHLIPILSFFVTVYNFFCARLALCQTVMLPDMQIYLENNDNVTGGSSVKQFGVFFTVLLNYNSDQKVTYSSRMLFTPPQFKLLLTYEPPARSGMAGYYSFTAVCDRICK